VCIPRGSVAESENVEVRIYMFLLVDSLCVSAVIFGAVSTFMSYLVGIEVSIVTSLKHLVIALLILPGL